MELAADELALLHPLFCFSEAASEVLDLPPEPLHLLPPALGQGLSKGLLLLQHFQAFLQPLVHLCLQPWQQQEVRGLGIGLAHQKARH